MCLFDFVCWAFVVVVWVLLVLLGAVWVDLIVVFVVSGTFYLFRIYVTYCLFCFLLFCWDCVAFIIWVCIALLWVAFRLLGV